MRKRYNANFILGRRRKKSGRFLFRVVLIIIVCVLLAMFGVLTSKGIVLLHFQMERNPSQAIVQKGNIMKSTEANSISTKLQPLTGDHTNKITTKNKGDPDLLQHSGAISNANSPGERHHYSVSLPEDEQQRINSTLPSWMQSFIYFQKSRIARDNRGNYIVLGNSGVDRHSNNNDKTKKTNAQIKTRWLIWKCPGRGRGCGGGADRVNGIVTAFYIAMCTGRVLLIDWRDPFPLDGYLQPHLVNWKVDRMPYELTINDHGDDDRGNKEDEVDDFEEIWLRDNHKAEQLVEPNKLPETATGLFVFSNVWNGQQEVMKSQCMQNYVQQNNNNSSLTEAVHSASLSSTTSGAGDTTSVYPSYFDAHDDLYRTAFWTLFSWSESVRNRAEELKSLAGLVDVAVEPTDQGRQETPYFYIGLHVRTGKGETWDDPARHSSEEDLRRFYHCTRKLQQEIKKRLCSSSTLSSSSSTTEALSSTSCPASGDIAVYVASDSASTKSTLQKWEAKDNNINSNVTSTTHRTTTALTFRSAPVEIYHMDLTTNDRLVNKDAAQLDFWSEWKVLMDASCIVMSRSGFSEVAARVDPNENRCAVRFDQCNDDNIHKAIANLPFLF